MEEDLQQLIKAYRMYQKMMRYPHLAEAMRKIFLSVLSEKISLDEEQIREDALKALQKEKIEPSEDNIHEYMDAMVDLEVVNHFGEEEIDQYINLARKEDRLEKLIKVVNTEGVTSLRIKKALRDFCEIPEGNTFVSPSEAEGVRVALIHHFISNQLPFKGIAKNHITIRDIDEIVEHSYWSPRYPGRIGGKAAGLVLAHRIILPRLMERDPELERYLAIPESYYFNSGIFSDFMDYNNLQGFHTHKYKNRKDIEEAYKKIPAIMEKATFPSDTVDTFRRFLAEVGEHPLILRSSSFLEDNVGHAFSGKYDSVFIANSGTPEERLEEFIGGLKSVLMSTFGPAPILYRKERNLLDFDERMSVLAQKVVGRRFGDYFFPFAAGVAFSFNAYTWSSRINQDDGLIRLVFGLGTRAVDRVGTDYPRMIPVSHPLLRPEVGVSQIRKYSQKKVDVFDVEKKRLERMAFLDLIRKIDHPDLHLAISVNQDGNLAAPMFKGQKIDLNRSCLTFQNFLTKTPFLSAMKKILEKLENAYGRPVDVEFAVDDGKLFLLQCRTLSLRKELEPVTLPENIPKDQILFINSRGVTNALVKDIEYLVYVDPRAYNRITGYTEKAEIGHVVGEVNRFLDGKRYALFGPGRWGSNDINLGVKVGYPDINKTLIIGEIAFEENGSTPEPSFGTHFFNDLVEADIIPIAIYPDQQGMFIDEKLLLTAENRLAKELPEHARHASVVHLIHVPAATNGTLLHIYQNAKEQKGMGIFAPRS
ncbi:pyruvate phosphate dikinase, PEP/pyruvate binding domain protein [delta proteobacterium NaphS2]|nr:pyruvate phosphate dikinase, PEP/pyruvate binding domain protein [delta proteobacterium NaphS2]